MTSTPPAPATNEAARSADLERCAIAVLTRLFESGRLDIYALVVEHGPANAVERIRSGKEGNALAARAQAVLGREEALDLGDRLLGRAGEVAARLVIPGDVEWPERLTDLAALTVDDPAAAPPVGLWVRGELSLAAAVERSVAVVGARAATGYGRYLAAELSRSLARSGWAVISGGAFGIDAAAHRGAIAAGGVTVAVLACGVDVPYPPSNESLFEQVAATGLLVSEWPPGCGPRRYRFLIRNRVIAALSKGTVVVEAARRSGSRLTARRAEELDRSVMAVPGPVNSRTSVGTHELIRDWGARLVTNAADVIGEVGGIGEGLAASLAASQTYVSGLSGSHRAILDAVPRQGSISVHELAGRCGLSPREVRGMLPDLVTHGTVVECHDGYRRSREV